MTELGAISIDSFKSIFRRKKVPHISSLRDTGRSRRGQNIFATSVSIPSKFQTIVNNNSEKRGFGSCSKRFVYDQDLTEGPDPSHYQRVQEGFKDNVSFSKKGTGTFASKTKRFQRVKSNLSSIAPGQYDPLRKQSNYFNKAPCTSNFHQPIAVNKTDLKKQSTPAPNHYRLPYKVTGRVSYENNVTANAAFKSKSKRELMSLRSSKTNPAPGTYDVNDDITKANSRYATAPFKSTTFRNSLMSNNAYPGPGSYRPFETVTPPERQRLPRQHYLCLAAPAMPLPPSPPSPGPGHYSLVNYEGDERKHVSGSAFVSTTERALKHMTRDSIFEPGPATYNPQQMGKQSFIYNADSKWI